MERMERNETALPVATDGQRTSRGMYGDVERLHEALKQAQKRCNVITPVTRIDWIPPLHGVSLRIVSLDPRPERGDVYTSPELGKDVALTKVALDKIAAAAGISWDPLLSGRIDDGSDPHYVRFRAVGTITDFDGTQRTISGEKEIDLRDGSPEVKRIESAAAKKNRDPGPQIARAREHILSMAESKAKNRAIRQALCIKQKYSPEELQRPFVVPKIVFTGETDDPAVRRLVQEKIIERALGSAKALYGPAAPTPTPIRHAPPPLLGTQPSDGDVEGEVPDGDEDIGESPDETKTPGDQSEIPF